MTPSVCVVGSLNLDRVAHLARLPTTGETLHAEGVALLPGGKGANQAVAAARLGGDVAMVGAVGEDEAGRTLLAAARADGVDVDGVARVAGIRTGEALILVATGGDNVIVVSRGANWTVEPAGVRASMPSADVVVTSLEIPDDAVLTAARRARELGAHFVLNPSPYRPLDGQLLDLVDTLVVNETELAELAGRQDGDLEDAMRTVRTGRHQTLVVTRGAAGAAVLGSGADGVEHVAAPRVDAVDTSGCGDAFTGALALGLAAGHRVTETLPRALAVGAFAATRRGAQPSYPSAAELAAWPAVASSGIR
ncbi:ribokinase [Georgenia alba]|uniref:Ribokinase n=1 Tax=Georgenia alba TaxID=2233858 RepID=A0ABW2QEZ9_9MICO